MWIKYRKRTDLYSLSYINVDIVYGNEFNYGDTKKHALCCKDDLILEIFDDYEDLLNELERFEAAILHGDKLFVTREILDEE